MEPESKPRCTAFREKSLTKEKAIRGGSALKKMSKTRFEATMLLKTKEVEFRFCFESHDVDENKDGYPWRSYDVVENKG